MIAAWMASSIAVALLATAAAFALDRLAAALGWRRRFIWLAALVVSALWPAGAVILRAESAPVLLNAAPIVQRATGAFAASEAALSVSSDAILIAVWAALSLLCGVRLVLGVTSGFARQRDWTRDVVDGTPVLMSPDVGPAVVGLRPMHIVLPTWSLDLDVPLRALVLRHEREHVRARDPYLLWVAAVIVSLVPWNLALWMLSRRLRLAIELDCDARVLASESDAAAYARVLLAVAQRNTSQRALLAPALTEPRTDLERRIDAMNTKPRISFAMGTLLALAASGAIVAACSVGAPVNVSDGTTAPLVSAQGAAPLPAAQTGTYYEFQVEKVATMIAGSGAPVYPTALKVAGVAGKVMASFVIRADSTVEVSTFKVISSTHAAFTDAVREALSTMRFIPAEVGGRRVKQLVQLPFEFSVK